MITKTSKNEPKKQWVQIRYSWGDKEDPVEVPKGVDPWEFMKTLAVNHVGEENAEYPSYEVGVLFRKDEGAIVLHYTRDNTRCFYQLTETDERGPDYEQIARTMLVLIGEGIDEDQAEDVLQAIGYTLLDAELFPDDFNYEVLEEMIETLRPQVFGNEEEVVKPQDLGSNDPEKSEAEDAAKWVQIWYSWGDQEAPVEVPEGTDSWEYAKKLAIAEAAAAFQGHEDGGEIGLSFYKEEGKIILHYQYDDTYCYYLITDTEDYEPEVE